mmetsp:Transcript_22113/g.86955  ORF Transcript_22113/g.86955 Transcript_22113/m.86955 type:complete len:299 (+) Transcript_22113:780-1676(+)
MRRRDLDHAGAELAVDVVIGDDRDLAVGQRQLDLLADQRSVALVLRVDHHGHVAQHRLRSCGRHDDRARTVHQRVADVPQRAVFFLARHLQVRHRGLQHRVPAHEPLAAVDQAFLVQPHEGLDDHLRELLVHREVLVAPAHRVAQPAHLAGDGVAGLLLPVPHPRDEVLAAQVVAALARGLQLALDDDLRGDAGVVCARHPQRVVAAHAVVARQRVHHRLVEGMAHVQRAGHIGRRQLDAEGGLGRVQGRRIQAGGFPRGAPVGFQGGGFEGLGKFGHGAVSAGSMRGAGVREKGCEF